MRIAIIGTGKVGTTLGQGLAKAGHSVTFGVRSTRDAPFAGARLDGVKAAVAASEVVLLATSWAGASDAVTEAGDFSGKVLVDVTNPVGPGFSLTLGHTTSGAEQLAALATNAKVVKAFNTTGFENMAAPQFGQARVLMPVAGDDAQAVRLVAGLATELGFEALALPTLQRARELEPLALLWIRLAVQWGQGRSFGFGLGQRSETQPRARTAKSASPKVITVIGTGNIGGALARAWLAAGHTVRLAVRDEKSNNIKDLTDMGAQVRPVAGSADGADLVVLAVPAGAAAEAAKSAGSLQGKVVIDCTNAIAKGFTLQFGHSTSSSEELAKALPGAQVVRAFNQQGAEVLRDPFFSGHAAVNFIAGDDAAARALVRTLSNDVGLESIEAGSLSSARLLEPVTLLWVSMAQVLGTREFGLGLLRR